MSGGQAPLVVLAFADSELAGMRIPLPGMTPEDVAEARGLIEAGVEDTPAVARLRDALFEGLGPVDQWSLGDEAALRVEIAANLGRRDEPDA